MDEDTEVWPENWQPLEVFHALMTQWNVGMNGVIGLRYEAIKDVLTDEFGIAEKDHAEIRRALRVMERAAVQQINGRD